jgi:hypothetical protein
MTAATAKPQEPEHKHDWHFSDWHNRWICPCGAWMYVELKGEPATPPKRGRKKKVSKA